MNKVSLKYRPIHSPDVLKVLDFTEDDGTDPLEVHKFAQGLATDFKENHITKLWAVINDAQEFVGFFTISATNIETKNLPSEEQVTEIRTKYYPALLLGQMGIGKKHRGQKIGQNTTHFCTGLALDIAKRIGCRYLVLQTDDAHIEYYKKCKFTPVKKTPGKNLIMMYRRLH